MAEANDLDLPSVQKLQSVEQMEVLDIVDSLRACGLSELVALPQLIVCGDQSSGKSSVLEAISGIPFPKQDTLCTRFATEVILRRAARVEINVSIVPGEDRAATDQDRLNRFRRELRTIDDFGDLFHSARAEMGLSSSGKSFSNDILRIEFCGPSQPQLTLVDLPGLIHSETKSQTTGDVQLVHKLVTRYLENPRSIILAVVSAKNDIGNQIILRNARKVDPQGLRTLGIITKPDCVREGSKSEEAFIALAKNEDVKFSLGWHMVKNLDSAVSQNQQENTRDQEEAAFFEQGGFNRLPAHTLGIKFLRARLSKVLFSQVRRELPRLVEDIQTQITATRLARDKLGPSRSKPEQQREFLISLSQTFQTICRDAVKGEYDHEFFQHDLNPERRLCASVMNMHFDFASNIRKEGSYWLMGSENMFTGRYRSRDEAIKEACLLLKRSRGRELPGLPNPLLVGELFRLYSRPWGDLARQHIKKVWETANRFIELLLRYLTDEDVCENIFRFWLQPIMDEKLNLAYSKLDDLLEVHKDYPMTTNSLFLSNRKNPRQDSNKKVLESMLNDRSKLGKPMSVDEITTMLSAITTKEDLDMDMIAAEEAFDNMNAYYEVAINLFTDNVPTLAIQSPIIREVPRIFCPTAVYKMGAEVVSSIAGESEEKKVEREAILRRLDTLEKGARICKQYAKRPQFLDSSSDGTNITGMRVPSPGRSKVSGKKTSEKPASTSNFAQAESLSKPLSNIFTPGAGFGSTAGSSQGGLFGAPSSAPVTKKDSDTGPINQRSFHDPPVAAKPGLFGNLGANAGFGHTSSPKPTGLFGSPKSSPFGLGSGTTPGSTGGGFGGFGGFGGPSKPSPQDAARSTESSGKVLVDNTSTTTNATTALPPPTGLATFQPFVEHEPGSSTNAMNSFLNISLMPEFVGYSCEV
ncbi:hypothetical protein ONS96_003656 [Cadophora gregata f. sp. sojae]|nr:hypothetical protein ONS96_003656 [Cadophora gregata f. sp. sojae]